MVKVLVKEIKEVEIDADEVFKALNSLLNLDVLNQNYIWKQEDNKLVAYEKIKYHNEEVIIKTDYMLIEEKAELYYMLEKLKQEVLKRNKQ